MGSIGVTTSEDHNAGSDDVSAPQIAVDTHDTQGYRITELPFGTKRRMKVIILGAGVSGISFFKRAEEQLENVEIVCYEKNHDVGGTVRIQRNKLLCQPSEALTSAPGLTKPHRHLSGSRTATLAWPAIFPLSTTNTLGNRSRGNITTLERQKYGSISKKSNARMVSSIST